MLANLTHYTETTRGVEQLNEADAIVEISDLHYAVNGRAIFNGLDLQIARGRVTAFMGPSGTGKTTLLRLITGQARPTSGRIRVAGQDLAQLPRAGLYALRQRMGMLFQNGALLTDLTYSRTSPFRCASTRACPSAWCASWC